MLHQMDMRFDDMNRLMDMRIEQVNRRIDELTLQMNIRFEQMEDRIERVDKRISWMRCPGCGAGDEAVFPGDFLK